MRNAWLVGILGVALPAAASAQGLGPRTLTNWQVQCADLPASEAPSAPLWVAAPERGDGRLVIPPGEMIVIKAGTDQGLKLGQALVARRVDRGREAYNGVRPGMEGVVFGRSGYYGGVRSTALLAIEADDFEALFFPDPPTVPYVKGRPEYDVSANAGEQIAAGATAFLRKETRP